MPLRMRLLDKRASCRAWRLRSFAGRAVETPAYSTLSTPVYSLSTACPDARSHTLNIVTYASPIAIQPDRMYALSLFKNTMSWKNMLQSKRGVLQILQQKHAVLLDVLGRQSGYNIDKLEAISKLGFEIDYRFGLPVLKDSIGVMQLEIVFPPLDCGDHDVVVCKVVGFENIDVAARPLYTGYLKDNDFM